MNQNPDSIIEYALSNQVVDLPAVAVTRGVSGRLSSSSARDIMRIALHHWGVLIASHRLISEQAKFDLGANICRNAAATAFHLGCRITTGTPFPPQHVYRNGVPVPLHHCLKSLHNNGLLKWSHISAISTYTPIVWCKQPPISCRSCEVIRSWSSPSLVHDVNWKWS